MRRTISLIIMVFITSLFIGCSNSEVKKDEMNQLTKDEKIEDFDYFINTMKENYCNMDVFYNRTGIEYLDLYDLLKSEVVNSNNNQEFYERINYSINLLQDGHTHLINPSQISWYEEGYEGQYQGSVLNEEVLTKNKEWEKYLEDNNSLNGIKKGLNEKVSSMNSENIQTKIIDDEIAYLKIKSFGQFSIDEINKIKDFYKYIDNYDDYIIDIRGNGGGDNSLWIDHVVTPIVNDTYESKTYSLHKDGDMTRDYYASRYMELKDIKDFPKKEILDNVANIDDYKYYSEYILRISNESIFENGKSRKGYEGNIYLLVDKGVFSSSEGLAVFCKDTGWATVVGNENSGGDGIGVDPTLFTLPNSGLAIRTTVEKGLNSDGSSNLEDGTELDLYMNSLEDLVRYIQDSK